MKVIKFLICLTLFFSHLSIARDLLLHAEPNLQRLIAEQDVNHDKKITVDDKLKATEDVFFLKLNDGSEVKVEGKYFLSNLLQELKLATERPGESDVIHERFLFENPVDRISRLIKVKYWDGLTRIIDQEHLKQVLVDPKIKTPFNYLYVPSADKEALTYFTQVASTSPKLKMKVVPVPAKITADFLNSLKGKHGLLALEIGKPFVVPGGRFNEMYGWDSYFEALGLIVDGRLDLAQSMVDQMVYEINHYGKILNANRSYYLSRSQPPFLTSMIRSVYAKLSRTSESKAWLKRSLLAAIKEYSEVWMGKDRLTTTGLSRYYGYSPEVPPEVEPGHFDETYKPFAKKYKMNVRQFEQKYQAGKIKEPKLKEYFIHDQAVRESGHDTTYRWRKNGEDRCADFATVDLNSLLYKIELDIAYLIKHEFAENFEGINSTDFYLKARKRKQLMRELLWDQKSLFSDYDVVAQKRSGYVSATAFYPLWAYDTSDPSTKILTDKEAQALIDNLLPQLETAGGIAATSLTSLQKVDGKLDERQWEYPNGWAPHQMIIWEGLRNYNQQELANRLSYKWLFMITDNAMKYNGTIPEKYDVVNTTHKVFAEYGNVGTKFSYITKEGFGWMNASYQVGLKGLPSDLQFKLKKLTPP